MTLGAVIRLLSPWTEAMGPNRPESRTIVPQSPAIYAEIMLDHLFEGFAQPGKRERLEGVSGGAALAKVWAGPAMNMKDTRPKLFVRPFAQ
jgi:hypothetical protein